MLIGGLGLWLLDSSGAAPVRVTPSAGDPTVARFVGLSNQQRALVSSFELRNGAAYNFVDVVDSAGAFAGHLPSDGYVGGVAASAASVAGGVVGRGFAGGALATPVLWRTPTAQPEQLEDLGLRPLELTRVSGSLDVCGAVAGAPAFWVPPSYRLLRLESVLGDGDACVGALPGGRFLVSRVSLDGIVDSLQVRITSLR